MKLLDKDGNTVFWASVEHYKQKDAEVEITPSEVPPDKQFHVNMHQYWCGYVSTKKYQNGGTLVFVYDQKPTDNSQVLARGAAILSQSDQPNFKIGLQMALGRALKTLGYRFRSIKRRKRYCVELDGKEVCVILTETVYVVRKRGLRE